MHGGTWCSTTDLITDEAARTRLGIGHDHEGEGFVIVRRREEVVEAVARIVADANRAVVKGEGRKEM